MTEERKNRSVYLSKEDMRQMEFLMCKYGENFNQVIKRSIFCLYQKETGEIIGSD